jgi:acetylglutamate kinase
MRCPYIALLTSVSATRTRWLRRTAVSARAAALRGKPDRTGTVIAPVGVGPDGQTYNINADTVAGAIAGALGAERMLMLTDVPGVLNEKKELIAEMTVGEVRAGIANGMISGGMIPKVETCIYAIERGLKGAVILDGRTPHAVLRELFTDGGAGTLIRA